MYKPMLFSDDMVRALMVGTKTQTRRPIPKKLLCNVDTDKNDPEYIFIEDKYGDWRHAGEHAPIQYEDIIYVRECWQMHSVFSDVCRVVYRSSIGHHSWTQSTEDFAAIYADKAGLKAKPYQEHGWRPNLHMPKWAARLFLKVTCVNAQDINYITNEEAQKDGFKSAADFKLYWKEKYGINNCLAWVYTFKVIDRPDDFLEHKTVYAN